MAGKLFVGTVLVLLYLPGLALASMDECFMDRTCGCGPQHTLASQVRNRELTETERAQVLECWLATYEYLAGALEFVRAHPGAQRARLPFPASQNDLTAALNDLLVEVTTVAEPRIEWIDQRWNHYKLSLSVALVIWRRGSIHPRIAQLATADGYLPAEYEYCDSTCLYYRLVDTEPSTLPEKVVFLLNRRAGESAASFVRLFELGKPGADVALALYLQGWPGVQPPDKGPFSGRLHGLLLDLGDARASQIVPTDLPSGGLPRVRTLKPEEIEVPNLRASLAYLIGSDANRARAEAEHARVVRLSPP